MPRPKPDPFKRIYFICGHQDLTQEEFNENYARKIRNSNAYYPDCIYFVGDAPGCDRMAQDFLRKIGVSPERVTIFHRPSEVPENPHQCHTRVFPSTFAAIRAMITMSTHDIAWVRPGCQDSPVQCNLDYRKSILREQRKKNI